MTGDLKQCHLVQRSLNVAVNLGLIWLQILDLLNEIKIFNVIKKMKKNVKMA